VTAETPISVQIRSAGASTVRAAAFDVMRRHGLTTMFANPGSTEVPLLSALPSDFAFVLALHEASVVGIATGWALAREQPALVLLHTTAGLGNAVGALATARVNRAPLVVLVGQQDRRHLAYEPFLAGRLDGLGGDCPVCVEQPALARDVPGAIARAAHAAATAAGPAVVIVPMDDWEAAVDGPLEIAAPRRLVRSAGVDEAAVAALAAYLAELDAPALVAGAGVAGQPAWEALADVAERLACPVYQEPFGARAGFPQDHPQFAGHLPAGRSGLRAALRRHDGVLVVGAAAFRQYVYERGPLVEQGTRVAVLTADPAEARRSVAELAVLAPIAPACRALAAQLTARPASRRPRRRRARRPAASAGGLVAEEVFDALAARLPADVALIEETPSTRPALNARLPARSPHGFLSAAMGGLGFALPAAIGLRMGDPGRPVVAVVGDGSSLYSVQALWSAAHYGVGALFVVLANGRYAIMDELARRAGGTAPWPPLQGVEIGALARGLGCPSLRIEGREQLERTLDDVVPGLAQRAEPLLLEVVVDASDGT